MCDAVHFFSSRFVWSGASFVHSLRRRHFSEKVCVGAASVPVFIKMSFFAYKFQFSIFFAINHYSGLKNGNFAMIARPSRYLRFTVPVLPDFRDPLEFAPKSLFFNIFASMIVRSCCCGRFRRKCVKK